MSETATEKCERRREEYIDWAIRCADAQMYGKPYPPRLEWDRGGPYPTYGDVVREKVPEMKVPNWNATKPIQ